MNPLHVLQLRVTDYGVLKDIHITPQDGKPVILAGDNGQGKSTTINAIEGVLTSSKIARPIRDGQKKAKIQIVLGNQSTGEVAFTLERTMTDKGGDALVIKDPEGAQVPSPAKFLAALVGSGSAIDPTEIMQSRPGEKADTFAKRQAQTLLERLGLSAKMATIEADIKKAMDDRRVKNSRVDDLERDVTANANYPASTPDVPVDVAALSIKITSCNSIIKSYGQVVQNAQFTKENIASQKLKVEKLKADLASAEDLLKGYEQIHQRNQMDIVNGAQDAQDAEDALLASNEQLSTANETNANVTRKLAHKAAKAKHEEAVKESAVLTAKIEALRESKVKLVKDAKLPVEGLEFTDDGLLYNGLPLSQESTGIQTRVCSLMAMAEEPACRILLLRNITLLNTANRAIIHEIAKERGYQVWEEVFAETKPDDGLWIVEGEVQ